MDRVRLRCWRTNFLMGVGLLAALSAAPANAQFFVAPRAQRPGTADPASDNSFQWADRSILKRLSSAQELLKQERYGEAVRYLDEILEAPEDYFVRPDGKSAIFQGLKSEAQRLIGEMPAKGRESYELLYGPKARRLLAEAVATGSTAGLAEVSRQFFHTRAGYQATLMLGLAELDYGRPLAGALILRRLRQTEVDSEQFEPLLSLAMATCWLRAGISSEARQVLLDLQRRGRWTSVTIAGRDVPLFAAGVEPVAWLREALGPAYSADGGQLNSWMMFRGSPDRNASVNASSPLLNMRWRVPMADDPAVEEYLRHQAQQYRDQNAARIPVLYPLAIRNVVLMRDLRTLWAVDFSTGKRLWQIPVDDRFELLSGANAAANGIPQIVQQQMAGQNSVAEERMWDDAPYGALSSDGDYVFSIEDLGAGVNLGVGMQVFFPNGRRQADGMEPKSYNRLVAYDIRSGKLKWNLGGAAEPNGLRLSETFFLGPPLPLAGRLYVLAEVKGEIRLLALDAKTGELAWSQQLAALEQNILTDPMRRLSGVSPSYADGIIVCPTSAGAVVGVELATRWLLWRHSYEAGQNTAMERQNWIVARRMAMMNQGAEPDHWNDNSVTIAGGRVIFSPADAREIYCLNLLDGKLIWKQPRQDDLYVACVYKGKVVLSGRRYLRALQLKDGKPLWGEQGVALPEEGMPSGRGFLSGAIYYIPLSTASVAAVDLDAARVVHVAKSREGNVPGNLVCYDGRIISQGVEGVENYYQIDPLRDDVQKRLAARPDDADALALRGEIFLDEGKLDDAIGSFRRAYQLAHDVRARDLLRDSLMDGLTHTFSAHRGNAPELEGLLDNEQQRIGYFRVMAGGLQQSHEWGAALAQYRQIIALDRDVRGLDALEKSHLVRRSRWLQSRLAALGGAADAETVAELNRFVAERWKAAAEADTPEAMAQFLDLFAGQSLADAALSHYRERLIGSGRLLDAELLLWHDQFTADPQRAAGALAAIAALSRGAKHPQDAAETYARLVARYGEVAVAGGKTGRQIVAALPADDPVRKVLAGADQWPAGKVEISKIPAAGALPHGFQKFPLDFLAGRQPFFANTTVVYDQTDFSHPAFAGRDGCGNKAWRIPLNQENHGQAQNMVYYNNGRAMGVGAVSACGHLLVLLASQRLVVVDSLGPAAGDTLRVLWTRDLSEPALNGGGGVRRGIGGRRIVMNFGVVQNGPNPPEAVLGPVTEQYICYRLGRDCCAVNPIDGEPIWVRRDLPSGGTLLGDEKYVMLLPPDKDEAIVLDARDGTTLGHRKIPPADSRLLVAGRQIVVQKNDAGRITVERFDPWEQRTVWSSQPFSANAKTSVAGDRAMGIMEPDGRFVLLALDDGRRIVDTKLGPQPSLAEITLLALDGQYFLVTSLQPGPGGQQDFAQPLPGWAQRTPIMQGMVYSFDSEGRSLWPKPASLKNQQVLVEQPARLPVLTFATQIFHRKGINGGEWLTSIICIDKRSGRIVYREKHPVTTNLNLFELSGSAEKKSVEIVMQPQSGRQTVVRLTFTDRAWPPESQAEGQDSDDDPFEPPLKSKVLGALWKSMQRGGTPAPAMPAPAKAAPKGKS